MRHSPAVAAMAIAMLACGGLGGSALAADSGLAHDSNTPTDAAARLAAIKRGLPLVIQAATNYPTHRQCFSCHHQTLPMLAAITAQRVDLPLDADWLKRQAKFTHDSFTRQLDDLREGQGIGGRGLTVGYGLLTLSLAAWPADETTEAMVGYLLKTQEDDGHWGLHAVRPPMEESLATCTVIAVRGLREYASPAQRDAVTAAEDKAKAWLMRMTPVSHEDKTARLWGLVLLKADAEAIDKARQLVLSAQHEDGGWAQTDGLASDAYATGTTLVALISSGKTSSDTERCSPAIERGIAYLLRTQQADGSWLVETRSEPVQVLFDNGDPHGRNQFIATPATCWALAALAMCP